MEHTPYPFSSHHDIIADILKFTIMSQPGIKTFRIIILNPDTKTTLTVQLLHKLIQHSLLLLLDPLHAGDMPPLLSYNGYAWTAFYDARLSPDEIIGRFIILHAGRDDFTAQPAGDSGEKIGCGAIRSLQD